MKRQFFTKNEHGRDFVCGDLHGAYTRVQQFLDYINFDPEKDRLFSVGDLVDRGPRNEDCLSLIYEKWFHAVMGNHEQMMVDYFTNGTMGPYGAAWGWNGGSWGHRYKSDNSDDALLVRDAAAKCADLPLMITVERQDGKFFHVIHAELNAIEPITDADLLDDAKFDDAALQQSMDGDFILWGRFIYYNLYGKNLDENCIEKFKRTAEYHKMGAQFNGELSHIYSGHTIVQKPVRFMGQTNIDTGAFRSIWPEALPYGRVTDVPAWAGLTFTEPLTDKFWTVKEGGIFETKPVVMA